MEKEKNSFLQRASLLPRGEKTNPDLDYEKIKDEIIDNLLFGYSQMELSRSLGYSYNQVNKWVLNKKVFQWDDFVQLCLVLKFPLEKLLCDVFSYRETLEGGGKFFEKLMYPTCVRDAAMKLEVSEPMLRRWLNNTSSPPFAMILKIMNVFTSGLLFDFIETLVGRQKLPAMESLFHHWEKQRKMIGEIPKIYSVWCCLVLAEYEDTNLNTVDYLTQKLKLSDLEVQNALNQLEGAGIIGKVANKFKVLETRIDFGGNHLEQGRAIGRYLTQAALNRFDNKNFLVKKPKDSTDYLGFRIVGTSEEAAREIQKKLVQVNQEILSLLEKDTKPATQVTYYISHCFDVSNLDK